MKFEMWRRKRSLVDTKLQFSLAMMIGGYLLLYTLFLVLMFGIPIWLILHVTEGGELERMAAVGKFLIEDQFFWVLLCVFIIVVSLHSIMLTRKVAGPIFVIRRHLTRAQKGELSRINFRKNDHLQDLKDLLNDHFDQLADKMTQYKVGLQALNDQINSLKNSLPGDSKESEPQHQALVKIEDEIKKLESLTKSSWTYSE